jgi:hypothetical protein
MIINIKALILIKIRRKTNTFSTSKQMGAPGLFEAPSHSW